MGAIAQKALAYAISKLGCAYSMDKRMNTNPDIFDCSSLIYRAYKAAGYTITAGSTSYREVDDAEFDRIWPAASKTLGQQYTSVAALKKNGYKPQPGDLIFIHTALGDKRENRIGHVVMVENDTKIIHARGSKYGVVRTSIDLYDDEVVAVTRYREATSAGGNLSPLDRAATSVCKTTVNIRKSPNGTILGAVPNNHPLVVSGTGDWLNVATLIDGVPVCGLIFAEYVSK